jgi:hypothetical protein
VDNAQLFGHKTLAGKALAHFARNDIDPAWTNRTFQVRV